MVPVNKSHPIRFERVYDGPVEDLWALWTTKAGLEQWFAPEGWQIEVSVLEPHVGGAFEHVGTAVAADALAYLTSVGRSTSTSVRGRFLEVIPNERLRIRFTMDFLPGVEPYPYDIVVELHSEGERVRMVVTADAHPDAEMTRLAALGLASQLRQFDQLLAKRSSNLRTN